MAAVAIQIGVALILSYLASRLAQTDPEAPVKDSRPTPLAERNSPIPFLLGRALIAPVLLWAGSRKITKEKTSGGKGTSDDIETDIYNEGGWHGCCVGPAYRLHKILQDGKPIMKGPITFESHPSGSTKSAGKEGDFDWYWGEESQPTNTYLGDSDRVGIESHWPFLCGATWNRKRLGTNPTWQRLGYELEVRPYKPKLIGSSPWVRADRTLTGEQWSITDTGAHTGGPPGTNFIRIDGKKAARNALKPGYYCRIEGNTGGVEDGDYLILDALQASSGKTDVYLAATIPTAVADLGVIKAYSEDEDDGVNAAHALYQLMFESHPHGRGLNPAEFDIASLEEIGVLMEEEGIRSVVFSTSADNLEALIAQLMEDLGIMIALDPRTGLYRFTAIRETTDIAVFPAGVVSGAPIEYDRLHLDLKVTTRVVFTYKDRNRDFSKMSITIDDDGLATVEGLHGADPVDMPTVGDLSSATVVALRRSQERAAGKQPFKIEANRQARLLMPGQLFTIPEIDVALICMEAFLKDPSKSEINIRALPNYYGISASSAVIEDGGGLEPDTQEAEEDLAIIPFEIPTKMLPSDQMRMGVARVRAHDQILRSDIYISADDVTFFKISEEGGVHIGGTFNSDIAAFDVLGADGFEFTELGPDITEVQDLSAAGQRAEWRRGRQVILTEAGEVMYLRNVTSLGGDQWRADGVLRGRQDSVRQAHSAGDNFIILSDDALGTFTDILLQPGETIYIKTQPIGTDSVPLDEIESIAFTPYGKGVKPLPIRTARFKGDDFYNWYKLGDDVVIDWGYLSDLAPATGAGEQGAGSAVPAPAPPDTSFTLRIYGPSSGPLRRTVTDLTSPTYTYLWADNAADSGTPPGGSGTNHFDVEIDVIKGGLVSDTITLNVFGDGTAPL